MVENTNNYDYRNEHMQMERIAFSTETPYETGGETVEIGNVNRVTEFIVIIEQPDGDYVYATEKVSIMGNRIKFKIKRAEMKDAAAAFAELLDGTDISGLAGTIIYKGY